MTSVRTGLDLFVSVLGAVFWAAAAFALGARLLSPAAGGVLALGLLLSLLVMLLSGHLWEARLHRLTAGVCPSCRSKVRAEHQHRRLEGGGGWLSPLTSWECNACGFSHSEAWPCPGCPDPT